MPGPPWSGEHCFVTPVWRCSLLTLRLRCWWCWDWDWDLNWNQVLREWSAQLTLGADCSSSTNCEQINSNIIDGKLASDTWNPQQYWFIKEKNSGMNLAMLNFLVEFKVKSLQHKSTCTNCTRRRMGGFTSGGRTLILCTFVHNKYQAGTHRCTRVTICAKWYTLHIDAHWFT